MIRILTTAGIAGIALTVLAFVGEGDYQAELAMSAQYDRMVCAGKWPDYEHRQPDCESFTTR